MIRISKLADYAVVVLAALSREAEMRANVGALAGKTRLPEPTVAKVLKALTREGIVESLRGVNGGYKIARALGEITVAEIVLAVDGPVSLTACIEDSPEQCDFQCHCLMKGRWNDVNDAIKNALESISLADMIVRPSRPSVNQSAARRQANAVSGNI
ncbi:MAG: SUF system Fe-S cluster assembly regulator [Alphaproteobacteria bacterium]|nr:SUF system Fe-S cluster assembly regulator [Alphaproteobacteria bacterium]